jgi:hypothetical protein
MVLCLDCTHFDEDCETQHVACCYGGGDNSPDYVLKTCFNCLGEHDKDYCGRALCTFKGRWKAFKVATGPQGASEDAGAYFGVLGVPGYRSLFDTLMDAYTQASEGKGKERHASGEPFEHQVICEVTRRLGQGYPLGQATKKIYESQRLGGERGVAELLGAINYLAAAIIVMREPTDE